MANIKMTWMATTNTKNTIDHGAKTTLANSGINSSQLLVSFLHRKLHPISEEFGNDEILPTDLSYMDSYSWSYYHRPTSETNERSFGCTLASMLKGLKKGSAISQYRLWREPKTNDRSHTDETEWRSDTKILTPCYKRKTRDSQTTARSGKKTT